MKKQGKFSGRGKAILSSKKPTGLEDFLSESEIEPKKSSKAQTADTESRVSVNTDSRMGANKKEQGHQRLELRLPDALAEALRVYAFQKRETKTAVVIRALKKYLEA